MIDPALASAFWPARPAANCVPNLSDYAYLTNTCDVVFCQRPNDHQSLTVAVNHGRGYHSRIIVTKIITTIIIIITAIIDILL